MKLYSSRIPSIASEVVDALMADGDIEVIEEQIDEVRLDVESVLKEYIRMERQVTESARSMIADKNLPYNQLHKIKHQIAAKQGFGLGDEAVDYITSQIIEVLLHSNHVEEVFGEDHDLRRKMRPVLRSQLDLDSDLDQEVRSKIKNLEEGTSTFDIEYRRVMEEVKHKKGLD